MMQNHGVYNSNNQGAIIMPYAGFLQQLLRYIGIYIFRDIHMKHKMLDKQVSVL